MRRLYGKRALLNQPGYEGTAAIVAELAENQYGWSVDLKISDCTRAISLDICDPSVVETDDERFYNDLEKVDILIDALKEFRKGMLRVRRLRRA